MKNTQIKAEVSHRSVLGLTLYTCDIPQLEQYTTATFADNNAILAIGKKHKEGPEKNKLQSSVNQINNWTKKWGKLDEIKSVNNNFTTKNGQ